MGQSSAVPKGSSALMATPSQNKPMAPVKPAVGSVAAEQKRPPELLGGARIDRNVSVPGGYPMPFVRTRASSSSCCVRSVDKVYCGQTWCASEGEVTYVEEFDHADRSYATAESFATSELITLRHVTGMMTPNGGVYTGQIGGDGRPHGEGAQKYPDATNFRGQWSEGAANGQGELQLPNGKGYSGAWKAGLKHGAGKERYDQGMSYDGEFCEGFREGSGILILSNGSKYEGAFSKGEFHGEGRLSWPDNRTYSGQWQAGLMHGFGKFDWPDGKSHSGHYQEDRRHGPGVFTWPDGSSCKGRWQDGKLHGSGTYVDADGTSRHGRWEHGERLYWTK